MGERLSENELLELGERMIRLRITMDAGYIRAIFRDMTIPDYLILSNLARRMKIHEPEAKVYLSDISREMELPINRVSTMVQNLQNKGYVYWEHDGKGTYIYLSEIGRKAMGRQQQTLRDFFGNVINRMGVEDFIDCLDEMDRLEQAMETEAARLDEDPEEDKREDN